eukprot:scaffold1804_cov359-Prasinococcus_capsulatus_cf.AAC.3
MGQVDHTYLDLVHGIKRGREATVWAKHLAFYYCRQWHRVEEICEILPNVGATVLAQTLVIETIHLHRQNRRFSGQEPGLHRALG